MKQDEKDLINCQVLTNSKLGLAPAPTSAFLSPPAGAERL